MTNIEGKTLTDSEVEFFKKTERELAETRSALYNVNWKIRDLEEEKRVLAEKECRLINLYAYRLTNYCSPFGSVY